MATPLKGGRPTNEGQPQANPQPLPPKLLDNPLTSSLSKALAQSKRQVDQAK
jgi:hypothetical protein